MAKEKRQCSLKQWYKKDDKDTCKTCALASGWGSYIEVLEDGEYTDLAKEMENALEKDDADEAVVRVVEKAMKECDEKTKQKINAINCELQDMVEEEKKERLGKEKKS